MLRVRAAIGIRWHCNALQIVNMQTGYIEQSVALTKCKWLLESCRKSSMNARVCRKVIEYEPSISMRCMRLKTVVWYNVGWSISRAETTDYEFELNLFKDARKQARA